MPDAIIGSTTNLITSQSSTDAASARRARQEAEAIVPLSPATFANVAAAVASALSTGRALQLRPGDNATINVPSQVSTVNAALAAVRNWAIPDNATLTIQVADGTYTVTSAFYVDHPDGLRIRIYGNRTTPANCVLTTSVSDIVYAPHGCKLGGFDGFRMVRTGDKAGIAVLTDSGTILCGPRLEIDNFYYGLAARSGGIIIAPGTSSSARVKVTNAGDVGIWAFGGGYILADYAEVDGADDAARNLGFGFMPEYGSTIICTYAVAKNCRRAGFAAYGGQLRAYDTIAEDNVGNGYEADRGDIVAHRGISRNNGGWGVFENDPGSVKASPAITFTGNALGTQPARWERFESSGQAGLRALRSATGRLDVGDTLFVNGTGGPLLRVQRSGTPANYPALVGAAAGGRVRLTVDGSDTDRGLDLFGGGGGSVRIGEAGGSGYLEVDDTGSQIRLAARGNEDLRLDTNSGYAIFLNPGGGNALAVRPTGVTAAVLLEVNSASGVDPIVRWLEAGTERARMQHIVSTGVLEMVAATGGARVSTSGGVQLEVSHVASAVNRLALMGAATGGQARILATGSDTNVGIRLDTKGTGSINLNTAGGSSQFQVDHTANAVNRIGVTGGATGAAARMFAIGSDTDVGLDFAPKNAGIIRLLGESAGRGLNIIFTAASDTILRGVNPSNNLLRPLTMESENWMVRTGTTSDLTASTIRIHANGNGIGFFGVSPVPRPTVAGSLSSGTALQSFIDAVALTGLVAKGTITA